MLFKAANGADFRSRRLPLRPRRCPLCHDLEAMSTQWIYLSSSVERFPSGRAAAPSAEVESSYTAVVESDLELLQRWRDGEQAAGSQLFERHYEGLYRFFSNKAASDIEDLIQQTFLACVEGRDRFRGVASFRAFLLGIARHMLFQYYRDRVHARFDAVETSLEDLAPSPSRVLDAAGDERRLTAALRRIPLDSQMILELHYWERFTHQELSETLGVTLGVVKGRIEAAKRALRAKMKELGASGGGFFFDDSPA